MPRIITSAADPVDYCRACFPSRKVAEAEFGNVGHGPDDRGNCYEYRADHPPYADGDYTCERCEKPLGEKDE